MVNIPATQFSRQVSGVAGGSKMLASDVADVRALCVSEQKMDAGPAKYIRKKMPNRILKHTLIQCIELQEAIDVNRGILKLLLD